MLHVHLMPIALEDSIDVQFAPNEFLADTSALRNVRDIPGKVLLTSRLIGHYQIIFGEQAFLIISNLVLALNHGGASASSCGALHLLGKDIA